MKRKGIFVLLVLVCLVCQCASAEGDTSWMEFYTDLDTSWLEYYIGSENMPEYLERMSSGLVSMDIQADVASNGVPIGQTLYDMNRSYYSGGDYCDALHEIVIDFYGGNLDGYVIDDLILELKGSELYGWGTSSGEVRALAEIYVVRVRTPVANGYWIDIVVYIHNEIGDECNNEYVGCAACANAPRVTAFDIELENELKNENSDYDDEYYDDEYYDDEYYEDGDYCDFGTYMGEMYVVNCESWVSLREEMSTSSRRLAKVPYGAQVSNVYFWTEEFAFCTYDDMDGFILTEYLSFTKPQPKNQYSLQTSYGGTQTMRGLEGRRLASNDGRFELVYYNASSRLKDSARTYPADNLFDGNYDNAWSDGIDGEGIGEKIWATWDVDSGAYEVQGIAIRNGYQKTEKIYTKNSRPSYITININGSYFEAGLLDYREGWQCVLFEEPVVFYGRVNMEITIEDVFAGRIYEDTCITELDLLVDKL